MEVIVTEVSDTDGIYVETEIPYEIDLEEGIAFLKTVKYGSSKYRGVILDSLILGTRGKFYYENGDELTIDKQQSGYRIWGHGVEMTRIRLSQESDGLFEELITRGKL